VVRFVADRGSSPGPDGALALGFRARHAEAPVDTRVNGQRSERGPSVGISDRAGHGSRLVAMVLHPVLISHAVPPNQGATSDHTVESSLARTAWGGVDNSDYRVRPGCASVPFAPE